MDKRLAAVGLIVMVAAVLFAVTTSGDAPAPPSSLVADIADPGSATTATASVDAPRDAAAVVEEYWSHLSADVSRVEVLLDLPPEALVREIGLAEYSRAIGGRFEADCTTGVSVADEVVVDCVVEVFDDPLAAAFGIGKTPTQFRVRDGKISRVGYLKPYSTVDLALAAHAARVDADGFAAACTDPEAIYMADAGVVYNADCGAFMGALAQSVVAEVHASCSEDCADAILSSIRPSRD